MDLVGHLEGFCDTLAYHEGAANILCMADVEDRYDITYDPCRSYTVHMEYQDLVFYRRDKMYVADMSAWETYPSTPRVMAMVTTVADNEAKLTTRELKRVEAARQFIKAAGYPPLKEAVHMAEDGNIVNSRVTGQDIRKAFETDTAEGTGVYPAMAKGKTVRRHTSRMSTDDNIKMQEVRQELHSDVMHVMSQKYLVSVVEPLHITLVTFVERETALCLGRALQDHMDAIREKGFNPVRVHGDPAKAWQRWWVTSLALKSISRVLVTTWR